MISQKIRQKDITLDSESRASQGQRMSRLGLKAKHIGESKKFESSFRHSKLMCDLHASSLQKSHLVEPLVYPMAARKSKGRMGDRDAPAKA